MVGLTDGDATQPMEFPDNVGRKPLVSSGLSAPGIPLDCSRCWYQAYEALLVGRTPSESVAYLTEAKTC